MSCEFWFGNLDSFLAVAEELPYEARPGAKFDVFLILVILGILVMEM